jgi:hypothetical protein
MEVVVDDIIAEGAAQDLGFVQQRQASRRDFGTSRMFLPS